MPVLGATPPAQGPRAGGDPEAYRSVRPVWRFRFIDHEGPWGWNKATEANLRAICERLIGFEAMTWGEIERARSCNEMPVDECAPEATRRLIEIGREQFETLFKLRIPLCQRLWGIREAHTFQILWWDPDHTVYPMNVADN